MSSLKITKSQFDKLTPKLKGIIKEHAPNGRGAGFFSDFAKGFTDVITLPVKAVKAVSNAIGVKPSTLATIVAPELVAGSKLAQLGVASAQASGNGRGNGRGKGRGKGTVEYSNVSLHRPSASSNGMAFF